MMMADQPTGWIFTIMFIRYNIKIDEIEIINDII